MLSRLASSSDTQQGSSGETSPDQSSCSSDTGDVLIRSTRVLLSDQRHGGKPGPGSGSVHITVQKLRDPLVQPPLADQQQRSSGSEKRQQRSKPRQKPENAPPLRSAGHGQSDGLKKPGVTKENREPRRRQRPAAETSPDRKFSAGTHSDQQPGDDLLTSRFAAGGRGVVLAALKQRSHSAPHRREVRVQLLDPGPLRTSSQDAPAPGTGFQDAVGVAGVQMEAGLPTGCLRDATNAAAAAAAAAVAAAAPLIKAQSDMEARMCHLAEGVQKLLQADREGGDRGRSLSQQTLHHLETLHSQQLQQQSQLLESALRVMTGHAPAARDLTASGQTPHLQVTHLDTAADVLSNQQQSSSATRTAAAATAAVETGPVAMATPYHDRWPEQTRDDWYRRGAPSVSTATQPAAGSHPQSSTSHSQAAARRANETLREMGRLKAEMKMLLTPEESLKTTRPGPDHHQAQQNLRQSKQSHSHPHHLQSQSQQSKSQSKQSHSHPHHFHSLKSQSKQSHSLSHQSRLQENLHQSQQSKSHQNHLKSSQSQSQASHSQSQQSQSQQNLLDSSTQHSHSQSHQSQSPESHSQSHQSRFLQNLLHSQQNQLDSSAQQSHSQSQQSHSQESHPQYRQSISQQSHSPHLQTEPQQNQSQFQQAQIQLTQSRQSPTHQTQPQLSQQSQSVVVQRRPVVPSMLEEAGVVLRQVRRQKKVLEENLEALLRAKTGEVLHCQLEAMAANRDWTEEVRIKKTVDAWIDTLTKDIQAEMSSEDATVTSQQKAPGSSAHTGRGRPASAVRGTGSKTVVGRGSRGQTAGHRPVQGAEPDRASGRLAESDRESYLTHLYGRAPYEGLRRTLKKSPYLRFSSPASPLSRKPRPRLVESITGVKVKSCKTQTCLAPPIALSPARPQHYDIIRASHLTSGDPTDLSVTPADTYSVPMAIPLGRPRMDSSSQRLPEHQQEVVSPPAPLETSMVAVDDEAPDLQSQKEEQLDAGEVSPPPLPPPPAPAPADIIERKIEEEENEEDVFPGTDFLSVADIVQQEEVSVVGEEALELDGGPSPPPVLYQGPVFPPQAPSALPAQDQASIPGLNLQTDALENRLVEWVEQQLMSRMISEMYRPPLSDPAQNNSTDQSESREQSVTSDIVEAAGGGGLQLFVDSSVSVDSALIRQLVNEVLTEHVALMLGQRDSLEPGPELEPEPEPLHEDKPVPLVPTPVPTPPPSPTPPSRETLLLTTPPPSEPTSLLNDESPRPITAPEPVATPISSPEPALSAGSPPAAHQAPPPLTWGDAELPLDEERPEEHLDTHLQPLVMSVAQEEPPLSSPSLPSVPPALSPSPAPPPGPDPRPASPSSSSEDSSSTSSTSSTSTVTAGTEAALKHISEGELLISVNQLAAMTEEEAVCSFSSSLQELQDMDFDPPSEGQVRGHELLLNKMEQRVTHPPRGERPQPEGSWGRDQEEEVSVGEVRDDWTTKPHRTTNPKSYSKSTAAQRDQTSPGQISQCADVSEGSLEATNQDSVAMGDLMMEPVGTLTSDLQTDLTLSPPPHLEDTHAAAQVVAVRQLRRQTAEQQQGGGGRVDIHLPSITPQDEEEEEEEEEEVMEEVSAAADTESSSDDVF